MEKAVLKTLIYADIFDYPLKAYEIHKWLIGKQAPLSQIEVVLSKLLKKRKIRTLKGYYFLRNRNDLVIKRKKRLKQSARYFLKAKLIGFSLKLIPSIKLVGVSGGLAMENTDKGDDIDLFLITSKNRLWLTRILTIGILELLGIRRKADMKKSQTSGKVCTNILLEEDKLEQGIKDIYIAHETLQMKVLWQRDAIYKKYLEINDWVFNFLPNWKTTGRLMIKDLRLKNKNHQSSIVNHKSILDYVEKLARSFQLMIMKRPLGMERIQDGALYFHPNDIRPKVLSEYKKRLRFL